MGEDIYDIGQSITDLTETNKSWEWAQEVGKSWETEKNLEKPKAYPIQP